MAYGFIRAGVRRLFRLSPRNPGRARADAEAELQAYVDARVEQLVASGMAPQAARDEAIRRLGGSLEGAIDDTVRSAQLREERMRISDYLRDLGDDLRFAVRGLRREPLVTAFIVLTLALGIGANAAMFNVVDRLLISGPRHLASPEQIRRVHVTFGPEQGGGGYTTWSHGWVAYDALRAADRAVSVAAYMVYQEGTTFGTGADAVRVPSGAASWDLFPVLGVQPALGRFFTREEDSPTTPQPVVVISHGLWQRAFGGERDIIGRTIDFGADRRTVVGVAPRGFTGPQLSPVDAWFPMSLQSQGVTRNWTREWDAQWLRLVARLKPGVSVEQANAVATAAYRAAYDGPSEGIRNATLTLASLSSNSQGRETIVVTVARLLVAVSAIVLLIACANVANLQLARAVKRRREVAVRVALGAGRGRLMRLLATESALLAALGAAAGMAVAWVTATVIRRTLLPDVDWSFGPLDSRVLVVSLVAGVFVGLATGLAPALRASRPELTSALKAGAREGGGRTSMMRGLLTVSQAALSIALLIGAGLFVRSLAKVNGLDLGIEPDRVIVARVLYPTFAGGPGETIEGERARRTEVLREAVRRVVQQPDVERASLTIGLPFQSRFGVEQRVVGWDSIPELGGNGPAIAAVAADYFETVGTRILEGRGFTAADREGSEPVAIVNRTMALFLWRGASPIGQCIYWGEDRRHLNTCSRIVGVVADHRHFALREDPTMSYYVPFGQQQGFGGTSIVVRPRRGREADVMLALRRLVVEIDPSVTFVRVGTMQDAVDPLMRPWRLGAVVFALIGALALVVAAAGLFSVLSYLVTQRTREFGVRIALGARPENIARLVFRSSLTMTALGVFIGIGIAVAASRFIQPLLFDVSARDPLVIGIVSAAMLLVALLAGVAPALRALRVDPMEALRAE